MEKSPLEKILRTLHLWNLAYQVHEFFYQLLRVNLIRLWVATVRYFFYAVLLRRMKVLQPSTGDIGVNAVHHNRKGLRKRLSVNRSNLLLYPLSVVRLSRSAPILSIGPRAEGEILNLMGLGFRNIKALDLISYSPWIELGDMHAMPYTDDQFAVVIMGWVLAYSDNRAKAAAESIRVTKSGGIIAVGVEYSQQSPDEINSRLGYELSNRQRLNSVADILKLFEPHVDRVLFSQDLPSVPPKKFDLLVLFSVKK